MGWLRRTLGRRGSTSWRARHCPIEAWWARLIWSKALHQLTNNIRQSSSNPITINNFTISTCLAVSCNHSSKPTPTKTSNRCNTSTLRNKTCAGEASLIPISLCFSWGKRYTECHISKLNLQPPNNKACLRCPSHSLNMTSNHGRVTFLKIRWICLQLGPSLTYSRCSRKISRPIHTRLSHFSGQRQQGVQWLAEGKPDRLTLHSLLRRQLRLQAQTGKLPIKTSSQAFLTCTMNKTIAL